MIEAFSGLLGVQVKTRRYHDDTEINWKRRKLIEACSFHKAEPYFAYVRTPLPDDRRRESWLEFYFCSLEQADLASTGKSPETRRFHPSKAPKECLKFRDKIPKTVFSKMTKAALGDFGEWFVALYFRFNNFVVDLAPSRGYPGLDLLIRKE